MGMSGGCMGVSDGVWVCLTVSMGCPSNAIVTGLLEVVWCVSGGCREGFLKVSEGCLEGVWGCLWDMLQMSLLLPLLHSSLNSLQFPQF